MQIRKFNFNYERNIPSFKIDLFLEKIQVFPETTYYPSGAFVREFEYKRKITEANFTKTPKKSR